MATSAYRQWDALGRPWELYFPILDLATTLRGYGYDVGTIGNDAHLLAATPEDHDPFSFTGWPVPNPRWWVGACDIMEPKASLKLPPLWQLGAQLVADKINGHPGMAWLKYINWTPKGEACRHESWEPDHEIDPSSDKGHIHGSSRSDFYRSRVAKNYDPVARIRAAGGIIPVLNKPKPTESAGKAPAWPGRVLTARTGSAMMHGTDVKRWQDRMKARGWKITADGWYGAQSEDVCEAFQRDSTAHGWKLTADGKVGPATWRAAWIRPVS